MKLYIVLVLTLLICTVSATAQVTSVNTRTGDVVIQSSDINAVGDLNLTGKIGFGVASPLAKLDGSETGTNGVNIGLLKFAVPNFSPGTWQHGILPVSGVGLRDYTVYSNGYNCDRTASGEYSLCDTTEIDYQPTTNDRWIEQYKRFVSRDGNTEIRFQGHTINTITNRVVEAAWKSSKFIWTDDREHQVMIGFPGETNSTFYWGTPTNATAFVFDRNDYPVLQQRSSSGGVLSLPFYDSLNRLRLGEGASGIDIKTNLGINTDGPNAGYRVYLQSSSGSQTTVLIKPNYSGQTAPYFTINAASGHAYWNFLANGHLQLGSGSSAADVDVYRSAANTVGVGGSLDVAGTLYLKDGTSKQVTWADNNSCGIGFKCLRIQN